MRPDPRAVIDKASARKSRRAQKVKDNALLDAYGKDDGTGKIVLPVEMKRKRRKKSARRKAFDLLASVCREFVLGRNLALYGGLCEIAVACGGVERGNTWYHAWPQKAGNGLKYDVRSQFASCSRCNMGEYGARYRASKVYEDRHKALLGEVLFNELAALSGRRQISTVEARAMADDLKGRIERMEWK